MNLESRYNDASRSWAQNEKIFARKMPTRQKSHTFFNVFVSVWFLYWFGFHFNSFAFSLRAKFFIVTRTVVLDEISITQSHKAYNKISTALISYWFQSTYILFIFDLISLDMLTFCPPYTYISITCLTPFDRCIRCIFSLPCFFLWCDLLCCCFLVFCSNLQYIPPFNIYLFVFISGWVLWQCTVQALSNTITIHHRILYGYD